MPRTAKVAKTVETAPPQSRVTDTVPENTSSLEHAQFQARMKAMNIPPNGSPASINHVVQRIEAGGQHPLQKHEDFMYLQRTIGNQAVIQLLDRIQKASNEDIHKTAAAGVQGTGSTLPHLDKIQQSFGQHDIRGVQAFTGVKAATASKAIGAQAYTTGNKIAFSSPTPDLHTTAHEATHVLQQRAGVQLNGSVGEVGDKYERHADAVADQVVKGQSAEGLINQRTRDQNSSYIKRLGTGPNGRPGIAQNNMTANQALQKKVGFEFQTSVTDTIFVRDDKRFNDGKKEYYQAAGFTIEGDEGDLELVTEPFEETERGFKRMASVFSMMEVFAERVEGQTIPLLDLNNHFASADPIKSNLEGKGDVFLNVEEKILTDPQTTVGIGLSKLFSLAELLGQAKTRQSAFLSARKPGTPESVRTKEIKTGQVAETTRPILGQEATTTKLANNIGWKAYENKLFQGLVNDSVDMVRSEYQNYSDDLKGFLFLIAMYSKAGPKYIKFMVAAGKAHTKPANAKFAIPLMSRTNMADLFLKLPKDDKSYFIQHHLQIAQQFGGEQILFESNLDWEQYESGFSIYDWLKNIVPSDAQTTIPGLDFASVYEGLGDISNRSFNPEDTGNERLPPHVINNAAFPKMLETDPTKFAKDKETARMRFGLGTGKMVESTDIGKATDQGENRTDGLVIELRKLGAKLTKDEWWPFASDVFKLTVMVNQGPGRRDEIINNFIGS
ncbi:MAG: DUF4157 domain-containing protein [Pseudomonadales bacterium]